MSQITRCPECQTRFKVVDDQLRISDGWVRCGKCKAVFDALAHLVRGAAAAAPVDAPLPADGVVDAPPSAAASEEASQSLRPPAAAPLAAPVAQEGAAAVLMTENSLQIDPNAQVPELSVLVFPRRANAGDSGYVDSSWMQAYEEEAVAALAPALPAATQDRSGLESQWQPQIDQRPPSLRSSRVDFSATDDLAELQAREGRLLESLAERQIPVAPAQTLAAPEIPDQLPVAASEGAAAHERVSVFPSAADDVARAVEAEPASLAPPAASSIGPVTVEAAPDLESAAAPAEAVPRAEDAQLLAPEWAGRTVDAGKVEPTLAGPTNYVAQMDEAAAASAGGVFAGIEAGAEPGFVRTAKRKAFWRKPWVVVLSLLLTLALLAGLLLQVAVTQRDRLAQAQPQWRPALQALCRLAGCEIALPRQLQAVSIDSTSFNAVGPRQFRLRVVLRNAADDAVAVPALELSLNDAAEKLVLRRVLSPQDLQAPAALEPHGEWTAEMVIQVAEAAGDVVGYRVLAFYP